jgi:hypothetical protein
VFLASASNSTIREQVERIIASGVLGRSRFYQALLVYLADCGDRSHAPKEVEIAAEVFDRRDGFDPGQDSMVRVYAHNLRQKLHQYYAEHEPDTEEQLIIPKGEYRLVLGNERSEAGSAEAFRQPLSAVRIAAVVIVSLVAGVLLGRTWPPPDDGATADYVKVAQSGIWAPVTADNVPVTVVVGDYYIFGELDEIGNVRRMVREFSVNSSRDLDDWFMREPENADLYIDLDLTYLPSSIAFAMRDVMGVLNAAGKEVRVTSMSNFDTSMIRDSHIVYLGYLSGLGMLRDFVFSGSRLSLGETYDELILTSSGTAFISEAGLPSGASSYTDYGLYSALPAPGGKRFVFIAGTRDEGLMQTARAVSEWPLVQQSLDAVITADEVPAAYELLYEVAGLGRTNLDATIVHAAELDVDRLSVGQLTP